MKKKFFKSKKQMIIYIILYGLLIYGFIYLGTRNYNKGEITDQKHFDQEFSMVDEENVFTYINSNDARRLIKSGRTIIFFGTSTSQWVNYYAKILNDEAKEDGITDIYYYDFISDRTDNNGTYESIVEYLKNYVTTNDEGKKEIYAPTLVVIKNNKVLYFDDETSLVKGTVTPDIYWNEYQIGLEKTTLKQVFKDYKED